jgi:hypothetical protein
MLMIALSCVSIHYIARLQVRLGLGPLPHSG